MELEGYLRGDYIRNLIKEGKRLDNRKFDEYRNLEIEKGYVGEKACGSAFVKLGDTKVLVGISMDAGEPYPDSPGQGVMTTSTELRPIASPYFESGPPRQNSIELARVIDRGIRESGAIPTDKLAINDPKWKDSISLYTPFPASTWWSGLAIYPNRPPSSRIFPPRRCDIPFQQFHSKTSVRYSSRTVGKGTQFGCFETIKNKGNTSWLSIER
ncbi:MAG: hypothetical protein KKB85_00450 [Candidatus Altiarchaeota archaeon]|nr:hypothetical protein [Candidatus Altiarchaeota archaeon]